MNAAGIIAEYNPFHRGHAYHLAETRRITGADFLIVVMSGDFVQRGLPSLTDKYTRAEMALAEGADLVLELPSVYACASAEYFACGAVSLLDRLCCVKTLSFGSECGDLAQLKSCADVLCEEPAGYRELLRAFLKQGLSFPLARSKALHEYLSFTSDILPCSVDDQVCRYESPILRSPNNTLGIEYLKALRLLNSSITPCTIRRRSEGYHSLSLEGEMASATALREALQSGAAFSELEALLPAGASGILKEALSKKGPLWFDDFSSILHYRLLSLSPEETASFEDVSPELASRIQNLLPEYQSAGSFADLLKSKQLTHTRITRALCHILLDHRQEDADARKTAGFPVYARVLGFRRESAGLLSTIRDQGQIPLISRPAVDAPLLDPAQKAIFAQDIRDSHIYEAMMTDLYHLPFCHEYRRQIIIR